MGLKASTVAVSCTADGPGAEIESVRNAVDVKFTVAAPALADTDVDVAREVTLFGGTTPLTALRVRSLLAPIAAVASPTPVLALTPAMSRHG